MSKLSTTDGRVVSFKLEILLGVEDFYSQLYVSQYPLFELVPRDPRATLADTIPTNFPTLTLTKPQVRTELQLSS